jgi:hypothetical protein
MRSLSDVLADAVGGFRAPGTVVVLKKHGEDGEEASDGVDPRQLFEIGSITKTMTALLVLHTWSVVRLGSTIPSGPICPIFVSQFLERPNE